MSSDDSTLIVPKPAIAAAGVPSDLDRLAVAVSRLPRPVFVVLDAGHWTDLPSELVRLDLSARSLFLGSSQGVKSAGPWLLMLTDDAEMAAALGLVGDKPAAVFWSCQAGESALWKHLRTINQAKFANGRTRQQEGSETAAAAAESPGKGSEVVLFRHWDPRALSVVLPLLSEEQFARVLGPAEETVFLDSKLGGGDGLRRAVRSPELPSASRGMLVLDAGQVELLDHAMGERSRRRVAQYLCDVAPELTQAWTANELREQTMHYEASGRALGLVSERSHMKWAYLMLITQGRAADCAQVTSFIRASGFLPERQVDEVMRQLVGAARERGSQMT